jgi:hypothetical protein
LTGSAEAAAFVSVPSGVALSRRREPRVGLSALTRPNPDFWRPYSLALNADQIDRPLLMQISDSELLYALETFSALREQRQPVDMYVYRGEFHFKWQPAHRRAIYARNLDRFSFWLQGRIDPSPAKAARFRRWEALRRRTP